MHPFDEDISVSGKSPGLLQGRISDNWSINGNPNGGYLLALVSAAMLEVAGKNRTPILTANYMARCIPGEIELRVEEIARSKQFCRLEAKLVQDGQARLMAMGTFLDESENCFIRRYESSPPEIAPRDTCLEIPQIPKFTLYDHMEVRLDPATAGWMENRLSERSEHRGWISFKKKRPWDICSIALASDAFPPAVFASQGMLAWVPTIELTVNIRNIPSTRWLKCIFRTRFINCGMLEEDGQIWDESGELVAVSRQIAQFRES